MSDDPARLAVWNALLASAAEEMGVTLWRTGHSPNIRERRDFSCAVFDAHGEMVAQAAHIPVHLGAMPESVAAVSALAPWSEGDVAIVNDPYLGGTHLPDVTLVAPVFARNELIGFVANRAHHADIGGMSAGSMPVATELYQEGVIIPPLKLREGGRLNEALFALILRNVRTPAERRGDFDAQLGALHTGAARLEALAARYGNAKLARWMTALTGYAERLTRAALVEVPDGDYEAADVMESVNGGLLPIRARLVVAGDEVTVDFTRLGSRAGRLHQRRGGGHALGRGLLRALSPAVRRPLQRGRLPPHPRRAPAGLDRERPASASGLGRQRRDLAAGHRRRACGALAGAPGADARRERGNDEQLHLRGGTDRR